MNPDFLLSHRGSSSEWSALRVILDCAPGALAHWCLEPQSNPARLRALVNTAFGVPVRAGVPWCLEPESNRHAAVKQAADFKSAVSTYFTIEAHRHCETKNEKAPATRVDEAVKLEARTGVEPIWKDLQSSA